MGQRHKPPKDEIYWGVGSPTESVWIPKLGNRGVKVFRVNRLHGTPSTLKHLGYLGREYATPRAEPPRVLGSPGSGPERVALPR